MSAVMTLRQFAHIHERAAPDPRSLDLVHAPGGAVKAIGPARSGRVGGMLLVFNSVDRSRARDYFPPPPACDFGPYLKAPLPLLYHHGLKAGLGLDEDFGDVRVSVGSKGFEAEGRLSLATPEGRDLYDRVKAGKVTGWSSGALSHRVKRTRESDPAGGFRSKVTRWHICEGSLTETPADLATRAWPILDRAEHKAALAQLDWMESVLDRLDRDEAARKAEARRRIETARRQVDNLERRLNRL